MCGRFTQVVKACEFAAMYGPAVAMPDTAWAERWNGAPTQVFLACRLDGAGQRVLFLLRWGLVPSWARDRAMGNRLINARAEIMHEKPAFHGASRRRRCLVPANGWFEWRRTGAVKGPYWISLAGGPAQPRGAVGGVEGGRGAHRDLHAADLPGRGGACTRARPPAGGAGPGGVRVLARCRDAGLAGAVAAPGSV